MSARSGMVNMIARVRLLIGDTAGSPQFTDDNIQDVLDRDSNKINVRVAALHPVPSFASGGASSYNEFLAQMGQWEETAVLQGPNFATLTPATSDWIQGRWTFTLPSPGQPFPVFITGQVYDIYAASADLCDMWAAIYARSWDFTSDGQAHRRSQAAAGLIAQAQQLRKQARPRTSKLFRPDLAPQAMTTNGILTGFEDDAGWWE